jgi:hypothetical protein
VTTWRNARNGKGLLARNEQPKADDWAMFFVTSLEKQHVEKLFEAHRWEGEAS